MDIYAIIFLIMGIFFIIIGTNGYIKLFYHKKPDYPQINYIAIFIWCFTGIMFILGAITDHIILVTYLFIIMVTLAILYRKWKYPSYDSYINDKYPKYGEMSASFGIWAKLGFIIFLLFMIIFAIIILR